jgi:hypothetical protein
MRDLSHANVRIGQHRPGGLYVFVREFRRTPSRAANAPRRLSSDALPVHPRRTNREYPGRLRTVALRQRRDTPGPASSPIWGGIGMQVGEIMMVGPGQRMHARFAAGAPSGCRLQILQRMSLLNST